MNNIYAIAKLQAKFDASKKCGQGHISLNETCQIGKVKPIKAKTAKEKPPTKATAKKQDIPTEPKPEVKYPLVERFLRGAIAQEKGDITIPKIPKGLDKKNPDFVRGFTVMKQGEKPVVLELPNSRGVNSGYHEYTEVGATSVSVMGGKTTPKVVQSTKDAVSSPFGKDYQVNLYGRNAGWKWDGKGGESLLADEKRVIKGVDENGNEEEKPVFTRKMSVKDYDGNMLPLGTTKDPSGNDHPAIISVKGAKHHYTLAFDSNVKSELRYYKNQPDEPRNKFAAKGQLTLGKPLGTITRNGITGIVYDRISIEPKMEKGTPDIVQVKSDRKDSLTKDNKRWTLIVF